MSKLIKNQVGCREKHVLGFVKYKTKSCHMKLLSSQDVYFSVSHLKTQTHQFQLTQNIANQSVALSREHKIQTTLTIGRCPGRPSVIASISPSTSSSTAIVHTRVPISTSTTTGRISSIELLLLLVKTIW